MIWAIREAYQEAARVQHWHRQGQDIDNQAGWRHSTTGLGIDCLFVGTDCLCGLGSRSEPHTGGADHRRDRPTAPQPPAMAGVEMRYLTNAARHRQTIQRMLDNGVEVVVAVQKDGVPPWCRRICPLHSLTMELLGWRPCAASLTMELLYTGAPVGGQVPSSSSLCCRLTGEGSDIV